jgi:hypothetical protein
MFIRARAGHAPSPSQQELIEAHWNNAVQSVWSAARKHMFIRARAGHAPSPSQQELIDAHWNNAVQAV